MGSDDYSFKRPGAVPFKWEIKPGVPKPQHHHQHNHDDDQHNLSPPSPKLTPPPSWSHVFSPEDPCSRSAPRTPSARFDRSNSLPLSCFLSPSLRRLSSGKMNRKHVVEPNYGSDLQRSLSARSLRSLFYDSMSSSSSLSNNQSLNRTVSKGGWAGFGPLLLNLVTRGLD
ncbi:hypothetical protein TanjilG_13890 [Lupinus angustifolius]|uniref:Uncharacterized protein n=1 Tax=Lupinus angustifolius TaxID=3871 RepID=A0A1J7GVU8_LUPAN|nr:PREDICTED: uncharacterized protein LOC109356313 [Lupinus angustifolius]OIW04508.1 hypothetical protein TanjilG_13890 [Lupinus angustifolius]